MRIAVTGASGLIGTALRQRLGQAGHDVVRLVRRPARDAAEISWDPRASRGGLDPGALDGVDAVVHLSGAPIAAGRWTAARKRELRASRVGSTAALVSALRAMRRPPSVLLSGSGIDWYGDTAGHEVDETAPAGTGFLAGLVRDWEAAAQPAREAGIRVACLRSGVVLSPRGGMLGRLLLPFRAGLGARIGPGTQFVSWISLTDHVGAVQYLLGHEDLDGPVNLTAPGPVTSATLTAELARALRRPAVLRLPAPLLRAALGELSGELLGSMRVLPQRLLAAGFTFQYPDIASALAAELARPAQPGRAT